MDDAVRKALEGSIAKWQAIVDGTGIDQGAINCPLCAMFIHKIDEDGTECFGCPVSAKVGAPNCSLTPYSDWNSRIEIMENHFKDEDIFSEEGLRVETSEQLEAAKAELEFLRSLLPP